MTPGIFDILSLVIILLIILNIKLMSSPKTAFIGNRLGSLAMFGAIAVVMISNNVINLPLLAVSMAVGSLFGIFIALKVTTLQIPQLVALLNGFGGGASFFVALIVIFEDGGNLDFTNQFSSMLAIIVGAVTLSGSLIAAAKLDGRMEQRPVLLKGHNLLNWTILLSFVLLTTLSFFSKGNIVVISIALSILALSFGVLFTIRIGGADMPVAISLLNSYSGLAAAICGFAINNFLLVAVGAVVGASGLILTQIMCRAMNRSLIDVLTGGTSLKKKNGASPAPALTSPTVKGNSSGIKSLADAKKVVIVPGYGMALAQAQWKVKAIY
ncbi:MAG: NAD synthetase, partial [Spirochaetae bacterium HGW-Spirochaetae-1]